MKVFWDTPQKTLQLEAQSAAELNLIAELANSSVLHATAWIRVLETDVGFPHGPHDGITTLINGPQKVIGLLIDVDPASLGNAQLQALQAMGQAVHQILSLFSRQLQADFPLTTTGVTPVKRDLEKQPTI